MFKTQKQSIPSMVVSVALLRSIFSLVVLVAIVLASIYMVILIVGTPAVVSGNVSNLTMETTADPTKLPSQQTVATLAVTASAGPDQTVPGPSPVKGNSTVPGALAIS
jgi:hypothetical protein